MKTAEPNTPLQDVTHTWEAAGNHLLEWGGYGPGDTQFNNSWGVNVTGSRVYVVEKGASRLQAFDYQTTQGWAYNQVGNMTAREGSAAQALV